MIRKFFRYVRMLVRTPREIHFLRTELLRDSENILQILKEISHITSSLTTIKESIDQSNFLKTQQILQARGRPIRKEFSRTNNGTRPARPATEQSLGQSLAALEREFPDAFPVWRQLFENGLREYKNEPDRNLSIAGHRESSVFAEFIAPYIRGHVLDIGCGPQDVPQYMIGQNFDRFAGLDPLPPFSSHPFEFVEGIAEFIPWPDEEFDVVLLATSFDHVLDTDKSISEMFRVLRPGGHVLLWAGIAGKGVRFDPREGTPKPVDKYHLFHLDHDYINTLFMNGFTIEEVFTADGINYFYAIRRAQKRIS